MPNVKYLFFHTAAADIRNVDARRIDRWHRDKGWSGIGYHYVIIDDRHDTLPDGAVEKGRAENRNGAQVLGANSISLGICCVGHGNVTDFTQAQKVSLVNLLVKLADKYNVPTENILGHREVNTLVDSDILDESARTSKSCPGNKVDTDEIRGLVEVARSGGTIASATGLGAQSPDVVVEALRIIAANEEMLGNAREEWRNFFFNGEIQALMES